MLNRWARALGVLARFVVGTVALLLVASVLIFALVRSSPGDPVEIEFGQTGADAYLTPAEQQRVREERRAQLGLDGPLTVQYQRWLERVVRLDLGVSYRTGQPVVEELVSRLPASAVLGVAGFVLTLGLAAGFALLGAHRPGGPTDHGVRLLVLVAAAVPTFLSGSILLRWAAQQFGYPLAGPASLGKVWLPALVMGLSGAATMARLLRASLIAERGKPYATAALARGASPGRVLLRHVARPAATPILTLAGLSLANLVAGSVITETVFSWPGVGSYAVDASRNLDYPAIIGVTLLGGTAFLFTNLFSDIAYAFADPRIRLS